MKYLEKYLLCFTDFSKHEFRAQSILSKITAHISLEPSQCCKWNFLNEDCKCPEIPDSSKMYQTKYLYEMSNHYVNILRDLEFPETTINCSNEINLKQFFPNSYKFPIDFDIFTDHKVATIINGRYNSIDVQNITKVRRIFKIGIWESIPWAYIERDEEFDEVIMKSGKPVWSGFCIDVINKLAEQMNFDYELVTPTDNSYSANRRDGNTADLYARVSLNPYIKWYICNTHIILSYRE